MRYSIMLQIVVGTTLILVGAGAFFGRLQTRPIEDTNTSRLDAEYTEYTIVCELRNA